MNERIKKLLELLQMSPSEMSVKLSVQRSTFSHLLSGRNKPSFDFISNFLGEFPNVNPDYLILGKLPYLRGEPTAERIDDGEVMEPQPELKADLFKLEANHETPRQSEMVQENENQAVYKSKLPDEAKFGDAKIDLEVNANNAESVNKDACSENQAPKLIMVVHHYSNGTFKAYTPN
jgi:transcriptional regulator with XRE-family HTH domain